VGCLDSSHRGQAPAVAPAGTPWAAKPPTSFLLCRLHHLSALMFAEWKQIFGPIPLHHHLLSLHYLDLISNCSTIPRDIGNLHFLTVSTSPSTSSPTVPPSVTILTDLCHLDLSSYQLVCPIPIVADLDAELRFIGQEPVCGSGIRTKREWKKGTRRLRERKMDCLEGWLMRGGIDGQQKKGLEIIKGFYRT